MNAEIQAKDVLAVPGKIFLLGEYSVLKGAPSLVATIKLYASEPKLGFGSSTAKWVLDNANSPMPLDTLSLWKKYSGLNPRASGADLIAQNEAFLGNGALFKVSVDRVGLQLQWSAVELKPLHRALFSQIHVFSAAHDLNRKLRTDVALRKTLPLDQLPDSSPLIDRFLRAQSIADLSLLTEWSDQLIALGLETHAASQDRQFIAGLTGVVGVKGCGAGLNDVFLVAIDSPQSAAIVDHIATERRIHYLGSLQDRLWNA